MWLKTGLQKSIMEIANLTVASYLKKQISPTIKAMIITLNNNEIWKM